MHCPALHSHAWRMMSAASYTSLCTATRCDPCKLKRYGLYLRMRYSGSAMCMAIAAHCNFLLPEGSARLVAGGASF